VALAIYADAEWLKLCVAIGRPELGADPALAQVQSRLGKAVEIDKLVQDWMRQHTAQHIVSVLRQCGLAVAKVQNSRDLVEDDEQLAVSHYFQHVMHPEVGAILLNSPPFLIDHQRVELKRPPLFGEHTDEVLQSLLCVTPERLAGLRSGEALK
jgi:benzylsuccinate CoA-transferase BbsF subunit